MRTILCVFITLFVVSAGFARQPMRTIHFKRGATSATITGKLSGEKDAAWYVLKAKKGQHMKIEITGGGGSAGVVIFPNRKQEGGPGGIIYDDTLPLTGSYKIRVFESRMANEWKGKFTLNVSIE